MTFLNKKPIFALITALFATVLLVSGCIKEETPADEGGTGSMTVEFDHVVNGSTSLELNKDYTNAAGETMRFTTFKYYLSNFAFIKTDGSVYTVPKDKSYFLITEAANGDNRTLTFKDIPVGNYKSIRFMIGVDSAKSVAPITERTGVLDPAGDGADMYWSWNSGYIFMKAEGTSPQIVADTTNPNRQFYYHIGFFGGKTSPTLNNLRTLTLSEASGEVAKVTKTITPEAHVLVDVMEMFKTPTNISVAADPVIMVTPNSQTVANNYMDMFKIEHFHN
jgi:hypothetical protein